MNSHRVEWHPTDSGLRMQIRDEIASLARHQHQLLSKMRTVTRGRPERENSRLLRQLAGHLEIDPKEASRWLDAARALEHLPQIDAAFEQGRITLTQVLELARIATPDTERALLREMLAAANYPWWPNRTVPTPRP